MVNITKRNPWIVGLLTIVTLGFYGIYWFYSTKEEINANGGKIPTFVLFFIPLVNIYFLFKFAEGFCSVVLRKKDQVVAYFLLTFFLIILAPMIFQYQINNKK